MPIYEYRCQSCQKRFGKLWLSIQQATNVPDCPNCGAGGSERILSRVARVRSEESRLEALADPRNFADMDENDPASVARWARKMGRELGDEMGEDFNEALEETLADEESGEAGGEGGGGQEEVLL